MATFGRVHLPNVVYAVAFGRAHCNLYKVATFGCVHGLNVVHTDTFGRVQVLEPIGGDSRA